MIYDKKWLGVTVAFTLCVSFLMPHIGVSEPSADVPIDTSKWVTKKAFTNLAPHPRLFVSEEHIARMVAGRGAYFADHYESVVAAAETGLRDTESPMDGISVWKRAVLIQGRLTALAIQWHRTKDRRFLEGALVNVDAMKDWMKPSMITLAEGQFIAGFAITYDLLYNDLTLAQRAWMVEIAREYFMMPFLRTTAPKDKRVEGEHRSWWQGIISNWNPVSISGGGLLALAMYEDMPEAQTMIDRVNASYEPIFEYLGKTEGGWVEGLGYWNWTIHYMSLFLTSYERATGAQHAGFRSEGFRHTLTFGTYFVPHGEPCGFGDNQHGGFSHSLMVAAQHLGYDDVLLRLQDHSFRMKESARIKSGKTDDAVEMDESDEPVNISYGGPQSLLIEPDPLTEGMVPQTNMVKYFPEQGWGMLANQWPLPTIYAAVRGGELGGPHTHMDLLSWHGVIGTEKMIDNFLEGSGSSDTHGARSHDIFERSAAAKNGLFIGGVSADRARKDKPRATTTTYQLPTGPALRLDATRAFHLSRGRPSFAGRLFAVIDDKALLVLDRVIGSKPNPVEARAYTRKTARFNEKDVLLQGAFETARMTFAADQPVRLQEASALLTKGSAEPPVMIRWQTIDPVKDVTLASLLTRGDEEIQLDIQSTEERIVVTAAGDGWTHTIAFSTKLEPLVE